MDKVIMFEVPVDNIKRASKFYRNIFGWQIDKWDGSYGITTVPMDKNWVPKEKGAINGEMYERENKSEKPVITVLVSSIDKYLEKIRKAGGEVVMNKEPYEEWGFYAQIMDTEGNIFGLWEEKE